MPAAVDGGMQSAGRITRLSLLLISLSLPLGLSSAERQLKFEVLQLLVGRTLVGYQWLAGLSSSVAVNGIFYFNLIDVPRLLLESSAQLQQPTTVSFSSIYDLHFGIAVDVDYWPQQRLEGAFWGTGGAVLVQFYQLNYNAGSYQGMALLLGSRFRIGHQWSLASFGVAAYADVGLQFPFALQNELPPPLSGVQPSGGIGLSLALLW